MNKTLKWILIGLGIALAAFLIAMPVMRMFMGGSRYAMRGLPFSRAGHGMMAFPMMGVFGFFRFLIPLGILALAVVGIVYLVRNNRSGKAGQIPPPLATAEPREEVQGKWCVHCGKPLASEGGFCPYCGTKQ